MWEPYHRPFRGGASRLEQSTQYKVELYLHSRRRPTFSAHASLPPDQ